MKSRGNKKSNKNGASAKNLYLSQDAKDKAEKLKKQMNRPSISNVVEVLIQEAATRYGIPAKVA